LDRDRAKAPMEASSNTLQRSVRLDIKVARVDNKEARDPREARAVNTLLESEWLDSKAARAANKEAKEANLFRVETNSPLPRDLPAKKQWEDRELTRLKGSRCPTSRPQLSEQPANNTEVKEFREAKDSKEARAARAANTQLEREWLDNKAAKVDNKAKELRVETSKALPKEMLDSKAAKVDKEARSPREARASNNTPLRSVWLDNKAARADNKEANLFTVKTSRALLSV